MKTYPAGQHFVRILTIVYLYFWSDWKVDPLLILRKYWKGYGTDGELGVDFEFQNIGKFGRVSVSLDGLTVLAGENSTGKSTVEKAVALYVSSL